MKEKAKARLKQLQQERQQVAAQLQQLLAQAEQARHMMSAYDGAIGELSRLLQEATADLYILMRNTRQELYIKFDDGSGFTVAQSTA